MRVLGEICLLVSLVATGYAAFLSILRSGRAIKPRERLAAVAGLIGVLSLSVTIFVLAVALVRRDFDLEYVAQYASRHLPWQYCLSALWVGQAGSLLLWAWMTGVVAMLLRTLPAADYELRRAAYGLVMAGTCFLIAVMAFAADPMAASILRGNEGAGLSPLLQHPSMLIHPPIVFLSYAAWSVPCALALAALWIDRLDLEWLQMARPWALVAWTMLGAGLLLGAHWAYQELGWGGYWGWDPVENGSLLPWLTGTALIHGMLAWRHRECLKKTALSLAIVTFALCNFATFLTRSGIFSSVHAFSESPIGWMFLGLMAALLAGGMGLVARRRGRLGSSSAFSSALARESLIACSAFLLVLLTMVVLVGTLVAPLSKMITGRMAQVGPEFYNNVFAPISLLLLAMTAAVPLLQWGSSPKPTERRLLRLSTLASLTAAAAGYIFGVRHPLAIAVVALAALTLSTFLAGWLYDAWRRDARRRWRGLIGALRGGRHKYAAYVIHLGLACVALGIAGSSLGSERKEIELAEGDTLEWAGRHIRYVQLIQSTLPDRLVAEAVLEVARRGGEPVTLRPARHLHLLQNEWTTEVAIHSTWSGDFYTVLHAGLGEGRVSMTLVSNPLIRWIWVGGITIAGSAIVSIWPTRGRRRARIHSIAEDFPSNEAGANAA
jgi:cytochrome c-type biogenesis protein CcmF